MVSENYEEIKIMIMKLAQLLGTDSGVHHSILSRKMPTVKLTGSKYLSLLPQSLETMITKWRHPMKHINLISLEDHKRKPSQRGVQDTRASLLMQRLANSQVGD